MVSFCNRTIIFLLTSGYRYRTGFRFKISTGARRRRAGIWGVAEGKIAGGQRSDSKLPSLPPSRWSVGNQSNPMSFLYSSVNYDIQSNQIFNPISQSSIQPSIQFNLSIQSNSIFNPIQSNLQSNLSI